MGSPPYIPLIRWVTHAHVVFHSKITLESHTQLSLCVTQLEKTIIYYYMDVRSLPIIIHTSLQRYNIYFIMNVCGDNKNCKMSRVHENCYADIAL